MVHKEKKHLHAMIFDWKKSTWICPECGSTKNPTLDEATRGAKRYLEKKVI
jgi:NADH pyrophosphatase NudC (nudix superfamily)